MRLSAKKASLFLLYLCLLLFAGLQIYGAFSTWNSEGKKVFSPLNWNKPHRHVQTSDRLHLPKVVEHAHSLTETVNAKPARDFHDVRVKDIMRNYSRISTTRGTDGPFIPNWTDLEVFRRDVEFLNRKGFVHNEAKFKLKLSPQSIIIFVQVHSRAEQLEMQIDSFRKMRYINETLVIFSHDFYSHDVFKVIAAIDFCPYMQIFYPYAIQVYSNQFPGDDPGDCPRDMDKNEARKRKCNNAEFQDSYGHYREAPHAQLKHHWLWKLQFIFEQCFLLRNFEGIVFRLDDDYYLAEDTLYYLRKLDSQSTSQCPECKMFIMGQSTDYSHDEYKTGAAKRDYWWAGNGRGMAFRRDFWNLFKNCAKSFCIFDDCNWDWSLMHVTASCIPDGVKILKPRGSRVFHLGSCKGFHQNKLCKTTDVLKMVKGILRRNRNYLFPKYVDIPYQFPDRPALDAAYGGWSDIRDHEMCLRIFNNESLSTEDLTQIHLKLFS